MTLKNKIIAKMKSMARKTYNQAAPIVKKELQKTVSKGKEDILCSVLDGAEVLLMSAIMLSIIIKPSDILSGAPSDDARNISMVYNEVHVTNNYYLKGDI